jgi:hypothetical protein
MIADGQRPPRRRFGRHFEEFGGFSAIMVRWRPAIGAGTPDSLKP